MKSFELEAARRLLFFLSPPEAAAMVSDTSEQAWRRWESGSRMVPDDVVRRITGLLEWRQAAIDAIIRTISATPKKKHIALAWYESVEDWTTLSSRDPILWRPHQSVCASVFAEFPGRIHLVRFESQAYVSWLADRQDSEMMRDQWAASVPSGL